MKYGVFVLSLIIIFFVSINNTHAQVGGSIYGDMNDVSVSVFPENPGANTDVTLKIQSFLINLASADISWSLDGKKVQSGVGMTTFKFTTKDVGVPTAIGLSVLPIGGSPINKNMTITPSSIDILWEAIDSATPPFYKGKALPTTEASLKFVAIPNIKTPTGFIVNQSDLIYSWTNNFDLDKNSSGYGKDTYFLKMPIVDETENVGVTAQQRGGGLSAAGQVFTKIFEPKIVWYVTSSLYGPQFERSIDNNFPVSSNDISVFAQPYYASPKDITSSNLSYAWTLNDQTLDAQTPPNVLLLHRNNTNKGNALISLVIENSQKYLQELKSSLTLNLQ